MAALKVSEYRYEKKYAVRGLSLCEVLRLLKHNCGFFKEIYSTRSVNNIYLDTIDYDNYLDNIEGNTNRVKIRIRWYGDLFGLIEKPVLEVKVKKGGVGKKISLPIDPFFISKNKKIDEIYQGVNLLKYGVAIDMKQLFPALMNRYTRKYFLSEDGRYRVTVDSEQDYYKINRAFDKIGRKHHNDEVVILELKYDVTDEADASAISTSFPFRVTKSSKYVSGLQTVFHGLSNY